MNGKLREVKWKSNNCCQVPCVVYTCVIKGYDLYAVVNSAVEQNEMEGFFLTKCTMQQFLLFDGLCRASSVNSMRLIL